MVKIAVVVGSTRPGRNGEAVARWVHDLAGKRTDARFRAAVADAPKDHLDNPAGNVTISVGAATGTPSASLTAEDLIARADAALYRSKEHGRNQVTMATHD